MRCDERAHAIVEVVARLELVRRAIVEPDERVARDATAALDALEQTRRLRLRERAIRADRRQHVGGHDAHGGRMVISSAVGGEPASSRIAMPSCSALVSLLPGFVAGDDVVGLLADRAGDFAARGDDQLASPRRA